MHHPRTRFMSSGFACRPRRPAGAEHAARWSTAWLAVWATASLAQGPAPQLEPPAEAACLVATDPQLPLPEYPFVEYKTSVGGRVKLELHFTGPELRPAVKVLESAGGDNFIDEARRYAATLRLPCLQPGQAGVRVVQDYVFRRDDRQVFPSPFGPADLPRKRELLACLKRDGANSESNYPNEALRIGLQGRVIVEAEFTGPDQPPAIRLHHRRAARVLAQATERVVGRFRLPCFVHGQDEPVRVSFAFVYLLEGQAYGFKPLTLPQLLPAIKGVREQRLQFDTQQMACPFDLRLYYRRPDLPNIVSELGARVPAREPLLRWLRGIELNLPERTLDSVYGDTADIAVPCVSIDIQPTPKETS